MINDKKDEVLEKNLSITSFWILMKRSDFIFDDVHFLSYKRHKTNPNLNGSYAESLDCTSNKKQAIDLMKKMMIIALNTL